jgi:fructokinase
MSRQARRRLGVDLGGTKIEGVVLDESRTPLARDRVATESAKGYEHILQRVRQVVERLRVHVPSCQAIGIGTPGAISSRTGRIKNSNTTCLNGRPLREDLQGVLGMEVRIENDANLFALAEALAGAGRDAEVVFGVIMGTGVGGGIVIRGQLLRGPQHLAGEWGHHSIDPDGPHCYCGQRGCVERYISGPAVEEQYRERTGVWLPMPEIVAAFRRGDTDARAVFGGFVDRFGRALANVIDIVDPDVVVLGGGLSKIDELCTLGRDAVGRYVFNDELRTAIRRNILGDSAGVIGAALLT